MIPNSEGSGKLCAPQHGINVIIQVGSHWFIQVSLTGLIAMISLMQLSWKQNYAEDLLAMLLSFFIL